MDTSGPILDRVDLHVSLEPVSSRELLGSPAGECSETVRGRVVEARQRQRARGQRVPNGRLLPAELRRVAELGPQGHDALVQGATQFSLSARATTRVLKVARTLADLEGVERVAEPHVVRALNYRPQLG